MHTTYILTLLATLSTLSSAIPFPISEIPSSTAESAIQKRGANWCTLHYNQDNHGVSKLSVYAPNTSPDPKAQAPPLGFFTPIGGGAYTPLPGYGDFLVVVNNPDQSVTFSRHGTVTKDSWTIGKDDKGTVGSCGVGGWFYGSSRSMDCGFTCVPYNGP